VAKDIGRKKHTEIPTQNTHFAYNRDGCRGENERGQQNSLNGTGELSIALLDFSACHNICEHKRGGENRRAVR